MSAANDQRGITDTTRAELREIAARYPQARSGLLPMLHLVQSVEGRVTPEGIQACADVLGLTEAEVSGVATFYTMYKRRPVGDYLVGVCTNTLCAVMGGDAIFDRLKEHLEVGNDETTADGSITLEHVECNAACDYAPVVMVNWEFVDNQTPQSAVELVDDLRNGVERHSTRGPRLCTWREAERVLAGFPDGLADEGPSAGPASLVGLSIARENGWSAPGLDTSSPSGSDYSTNDDSSAGRGGNGDSAGRGGDDDSAGRGGDDDSAGRGGDGDSAGRGGDGDSAGRGGDGDSAGRGGDGDSAGRGGDDDSAGRGGNGDSAGRGGDGDSAGRVASASERIETKEAAVAEADTHRAESETVAEESTGDE